MPPQHVPLISSPSVREPEPAEQPGIISTIASKVFNIGSGLLSIVKNLWNSYGILYSVPLSIRGDDRSQSAIAFVQYLTTNYPDAHLPGFNTGQLAAVLEECYSSRRPLLIYIHSQDTSDAFITDVLGSEVVSTILNENFVVWAVMNDSNDGRTAAKLLNVASFPIFSVIRVNNARHPEVLETMPGETNIGNFIEFLERNLALFDAPSAYSIPQTTNRYVDSALQQERL